ncbi:MFS transporter, partial [candidate division TA06 bacterium]|nr:MFS transporter [candidate division TA06 bacterium]
GPVLGGWLIENASWRWVFFINVPLSVVVLIILFWRVPESRDEEGPKRLDWWGVMLVTIGLGGIVYGLIESANLSLSHPLVLSALAVGTIALLAFLIVEGRNPWPMMPLRLFRSRNFSGANLLTLFLYAALAGALFFVPFNLIQVQGYSATAAGAAFLPLILILFLLSRWAGGLVGRYGAKLPLTVGPSIAAVGFVLFAVPGIGGSYWTTFFPAFLVLGLGMAVSVAPLTTTVMGAVAEHRSGIASGINNAMSRTAGLLAIAVLGIIVLNVFNRSLDTRLTELQIPREVQHTFDDQRIKLAGAEVSGDLGDELKGVLENAIAESFVDSFRLVMYIAAGLSLMGALTAWLMIEGGKSKPKLAQIET